MTLCHVTLPSVHNFNQNNGFPVVGWKFYRKRLQYVLYSLVNKTQSYVLYCIYLHQGHVDVSVYQHMNAGQNVIHVGLFVHNVIHV